MSKNAEEIISKEVIRLLNIPDKSRYNDAFTELRYIYKDDKLVDEIQQTFTHRYKSIKKRANKFADILRKYYGSAQMPYHEIINKAKNYSKNYNITDEEFTEFQRIYEQELAGVETNVDIIPMTKLMKVLGQLSIKDQKMEIAEYDFNYLQEILKEYEMSKSFHAQTLLQSLQYIDLAPQSTLEVKIDRSTHNPTDHVQPIIVAMFLPKIDLFESHFLFSNIGGIVSLRYNKQPLVTKPDYELFYSLVTDPNDIVCNDKSPMGDLLNRYRIQHHLWSAVLHLRNGRVYNPLFKEFTKMIDSCRLNKYDNPDLTYGRHDGTVLKRLLNAFSFRPTVVATMPIMNVANPYGLNHRAVVTSISMINIKLQAYQNTNNMQPTGVRPVGFNRMDPLAKIALSSALTQPQIFIEKNVLVKRITEVIYSREVLIFYVDRRSHVLQFGAPFNISQLPTGIGGFERINPYEIEIECSITIRPLAPNPDVFCLRSVVVAEVSPPLPNSDNPHKIVIGSSAFIFDYYPDANGVKSCDNGAGYGRFNIPLLGGNQNNCNNASAIHHYDPINALKHGSYAIYEVLNNIAGGLPVSGITSDEAAERIRQQGIVFIYQNFNYKKDKDHIAI